MSTTLAAGSCFSCSDSSLSTTASVISILTFAIAVAASVRLYTSKVRYSRPELHELLQSTVNAHDGMEQAAEALQRLKKGSDSDALRHDMERALDRARAPFTRLEKSLQRIQFIENHKFNLRARFNFMVLQNGLLQHSAAFDKLSKDVQRTQDRLERAQIEGEHRAWFTQIDRCLEALETSQYALQEAFNATTEDTNRSQWPKVTVSNAEPSTSPQKIPSLNEKWSPIDEQDQT